MCTVKNILLITNYSRKAHPEYLEEISFNICQYLSNLKGSLSPVKFRILYMAKNQLCYWMYDINSSRAEKQYAIALSLAGTDAQQWRARASKTFKRIHLRAPEEFQQFRFSDVFEIILVERHKNPQYLSDPSAIRKALSAKHHWAAYFIDDR